MRILLVNPNTSADMTERIGAEARRRCSAGTAIVAVTAAFGCAVIASRASYAIAAHAALDACARHLDGMDAVILACFGDPGLEALREVSPVPVIGLAESAVNDAAERGAPFAILTAGLAWAPMLTELVRLSPHAALFRGVFALDTTGLSVSRGPDRFIAPVNAQLQRAHAAGASTVILGGSAFAGLGPRLQGGVALVDPLEAAIRDAERKVGAVGHRPAPPPLASCGLAPPLATLLAKP